MRTPLCDSRCRVKLLKVGFTGKEIEQIHLCILGDDIEIIGVKWCDCQRCEQDHRRNTDVS